MRLRRLFQSFPIYLSVKNLGKIFPAVRFHYALEPLQTHCYLLGMYTRDDTCLLLAFEELLYYEPKKSVTPVKMTTGEVYLPLRSGLTQKFGA